jgi:hypothetical protein
VCDWVQFVADMEGLVVQSEDNIIQLQSARDDLAELENELFVRKEAIKTQIRRTVHELVRSINERETQLVGQVETFYDTVPVSTDRQKVTVFHPFHFLTSVFYFLPTLIICWLSDMSFHF